jgi:F-type H+-transporting ATPase subunit a
MLVGILEVIGEFTRVLSLSLRLFLNTAVGDILLAVFTGLVLASGRTPFAVIPIFLFEGLVAYVQAYVFMVLTGTYLGMAIAHADEHHDDHPPANIPDGVESRGMMGG